MGWKEEINQIFQSVCNINPKNSFAVYLGQGGGVFTGDLSILQKTRRHSCNLMDCVIATRLD